jgi:hypothetical protein|eukprot:SAG25_NODE_38_length_19656_cov_132.022038_8_plen_45_part_00
MSDRRRLNGKSIKPSFDLRFANSKSVRVRAGIPLQQILTVATGI